MPRERPKPPPFEPEWLRRSLDRYLTIGIVFMVILIAGFATYRVREPELRRVALRQQTASYRSIGRQLFASSCAQCHGREGEGAGSAPTLKASEFLKSTSDEQMRFLITGGVSGTSMPAWGLDYGGTMTDEQVRQIVAFLRSFEATAPSIPGWRKSDAAAGRKS